jgi:flagellar motility protein MotE (MotC chaperone)
MKSSYELAMERMGGGKKSLTDSQKAEISEIDAKYKAKIAEKKIFLEKSISEAEQSGDEETVQKLRKQVAEEIASLENKAEREKENIHEQK